MQTNLSKWPMFNRARQHTDLMDRMLAASNVDMPNAVRAEHGEAIVRVRTCCLQCSADEKCRAWLDSSKSCNGSPSFCPNAKFLEKYKRCCN